MLFREEEFLFWSLVSWQRSTSWFVSRENAEYKRATYRHCSNARSAAEYAGVARFADFVLRSDVQAEWHQRTGNVPLTRVAYELTRAQGFYRRQPGYEVAVRQLVIRNPTPESSDSRLGALPRIRSIADEELESVWSGGKTPVEALNAAVARGNALLRNAR